MEGQISAKDAVEALERVDLRPRPGRTRRSVDPGFDLLTSKLRHPAVRPGTIHRLSLISRLAHDDGRAVVSVVAPSGYGKTTLLAQWTARDARAVAWVSVDERDNDPKVLLSYVAEALDAVQSLPGRVFEALASPVSSVPGSVVPRLASAFWSMTVPLLLVLDDVHLLRNAEGRDAVSVLAGHVPPGSRLILAGRGQPPLRIARLRAEDRLTEIGAADLALTRGEAASLLRTAGVTLGEDDLAALHQRTEGWPAGLYLAALYLREGGSPDGAVASFGGDDQFVSQYMESEFLARISQRHRAFLTRTAVLERMCGSLCEAVLAEPGSAAALADLARSNLLLVPLDRRALWYRYHHLFRDMLLAELERLEPGLMPVLRRRAAAWCMAHGRTEEALEYSIAAGDVEVVAQLVEKLALPGFRRARQATLQRWFQWLDDHDGITGHPMAAVWASLLASQLGRPADAERWADAVDDARYGGDPGSGDPGSQAWAAVLRALMCRQGVEQMLADAEEAVRRFAAAGIVVPVAGTCRGIALVLSGDPEGADAVLAETISEGEGIGAPDVLAAAFCERTLLAIARGDWSAAGAFARQAGDVVRRAGIEDTFACAVQARVALHQGDVQAAQRELVSAQRLRPLLTYVQPHLAVQARIELAHVHLALADMGGARTVMREIDEVFRRRPDLGTLAEAVQALRARLAAERAPAAAGASSLTGAELRVLPMLATHMSFPEIGAEMFLSPHTVKSQAMSIYRKLGASSRHQAVTRSRELGLLEG
jgi:LuxR family transcriptional regulator, maltose regulon positive regulatory protein